jgi:hypothetical protein
MTDYGNPDVDAMPDDAVFSDEATNSVLRRRDALVNALRDAKGTIDAKAAHALDQLEAAGWLMLHIDDGAPVQLRPGQQVVEVPDGHTVEVVATTPTYSYADSELDTLAGIVTQLEGLDPESRERVAGFVTHRYGPVTPVPVGRPSWLDITRPPGHDLPHPGRVGGETG